MAQSHAKILVADDYAGVRDSIAAALPELGYEVRCSETGRDALAVAVSAGPFELLVADRQHLEVAAAQGQRAQRAEARAGGFGGLAGPWGVEVERDGDVGEPDVERVVLFGLTAAAGCASRSPEESTRASGFGVRPPRRASASTRVCSPGVASPHPRPSSPSISASSSRPR